MKFYSKGYTFWIMPKGRVYNSFNNLIKKLADENNAPVFEPHITLLGDIELPELEMIKKTQQLVQSQKPFPVTLRQIGYQDFHFRALFVKLEVTDPLQALHNRAKEIFGMQGIPSYMPHLSLLYGNISQEVKNKIIAEIGVDQTAHFEIESIHLVKGGKVEEWQIVKEFPFKSV